MLNFKPLKIKSIKSVGIKTVYDITVEHDHSYVANGFVSHNSSDSPNLQQVPRMATNQHIKPLFIPPPGELIIQFDYKQAELVIFSFLANEREMIRWFKEGKDVHIATACKKYNEDYDMVKNILADEAHTGYKEWVVKRKQAKTLNFGIIYGQGANKLSLALSTNDHKVSREEAQQFLDEYFETFPNIKKYIKKITQQARKDGYIKSPFGRKRRLPNLYSQVNGVRAEAERQIINSPPQATASDFTLWASILIDEAIEKGEIPQSLKQRATVHDAIQFSGKPEDVHKLVPPVLDIFSNSKTFEWFGFELKGIKMGADCEIGLDWGHLSKYKPDFDYTSLVKTNS